MKKITLSLLVLLLSVFFLTQNVFSQAPCEWFLNYANGDYVAMVVPGWTTWNNNPGSEEDALITDTIGYVGWKSFVVEGGTNLVQLFDTVSITSGVYRYFNNMYIPDGFTGNFNLQKDIVPGVDCGFQAFFNGDGSATIDAGAPATAAFTFTFDEWHSNLLIVDLDNNYCQYWFDDSLIVAYQWSLGSTGTPGYITLGGANYSAVAGVGDPKAYFDQVCFFRSYPGGSENFDSLTVGGYVAEQLGGFWTTWSGAPGPEDARVTDALSNSPDNSFVVDSNVIDLVFQFGDYAIVSGQWLYSHYMYVPTGFTAYFNIQTHPTPAMGWNLELYFNDNGTGRFDGGSHATFTYDMDTWFLVEINYDYDAWKAWVTIDGRILTIFSNSKRIGGCNYYGWDDAGPPGAYYDDVCFKPGDIYTGIEEPTMFTSKIYPNPARDQITIKSENNIDEVRIYNNLGQLVYSVEHNNEQVMVNTSNFNTGMYIVEIVFNDNVERRKLLVQ